MRNEVENWMKRQNVMIVGLQETHSANNTRESRKQYTWFFSGEGGREAWTAGVAIIVNSKFLQFIKDIEPIDDRPLRPLFSPACSLLWMGLYEMDSRTPEQRAEFLSQVEERFKEF